MERNRSQETDSLQQRIERYICKTVKVCTKGDIPSEVHLGALGTLKTHRFVPDPLRCYKCQNYGHTTGLLMPGPQLDLQQESPNRGVLKENPGKPTSDEEMHQLWRKTCGRCHVLSNAQDKSQRNQEPLLCGSEQHANTCPTNGRTLPPCKHTITSEAEPPDTWASPGPQPATLHPRPTAYTSWTNDESHPGRSRTSGQSPRNGTQDKGTDPLEHIPMNRKPETLEEQQPGANPDSRNPSRPANYHEQVVPQAQPRNVSG